MTKGLVLGKFMPLHKGHLELIRFAAQNCDILTVLLCFTETESISGAKRLSWLTESLKDYSSVRIESLLYDESKLSSSSQYSEVASKAWSVVLKGRYPDTNIFFSSEAYGEAVARHMNIRHVAFDRSLIPISGSEIRSNPFRFWHYLPSNVQPYFVKKVCLVGSESTGKSTLAERLARHFHTIFVPERARDIIGHTESCKFEDLSRIAELQAHTIMEKQEKANKILFCDTDIKITRSYAQYLFGRELEVPQWIEKANNFDLYIFLKTDCPFVQDGTRLNEEERELLNRSHKDQLHKAGVKYQTAGGDWDARFQTCCRIVTKQFFE